MLCSEKVKFLVVKTYESLPLLTKLIFQELRFQLKFFDRNLPWRDIVFYNPKLEITGCVIQLAEHALPKLVGLVRFPFWSCRRLEKRYLRPSNLAFGDDGRVQGNGSRAMLSLTPHLCSIHCESSRVAHTANKRWMRGRPRVIFRKECKTGYKRNWTEIKKDFTLSTTTCCKSIYFAYQRDNELFRFGKFYISSLKFVMKSFHVYLARYLVWWKSIKQCEKHFSNAFE